MCISQNLAYMTKYFNIKTLEKLLNNCNKKKQIKIPNL